MVVVPTFWTSSCKTPDTLFTSGLCPPRKALLCRLPGKPQPTTSDQHTNKQPIMTVPYLPKPSPQAGPYFLKPFARRFYSGSTFIFPVSPRQQRGRELADRRDQHWAWLSEWSAGGDADRCARWQTSMHLHFLSCPPVNASGQRTLQRALAATNAVKNILLGCPPCAPPAVFLGEEGPPRVTWPSFGQWVC